MEGGARGPGEHHTIDLAVTVRRDSGRRCVGLDLGLSGSIVPRVWLGSEGEGEIGCTISGCLDGSGVIAIRVNQTQTHDKKEHWMSTPHHSTS